MSKNTAKNNAPFLGNVSYKVFCSYEHVFVHLSSVYDPQPLVDVLLNTLMILLMF